MLVTPTIYINTKFSPSNVPDTPELVTRNYTGIQLPDMDILQELISEISVRTTWQQIQGADMISLHNRVTGVTWWYYIMEPPTMTSVDVARLKIALDGVLSIGGWNQLKIIDGYTERYHVTDDTFGKYTDDDPLLICSEPLKLETSGWKFNSDTNISYKILESTIELDEMGTGAPPSKQWVDPSDSSIVVTVPSTTPVYTPTEYETANNPEQTGNSKLTNAGTGCFIYSIENGDSITFANANRLGLQRCRDINAESGIIGQYELQASHATVVYDTNELGDPTKVTKIVGRYKEEPTGLNFEFTPVKNKRVLYGALCTYGIITTAGNSLVGRPEEIYHSGDISPKIVMRADPRSSGCPYYRYEYFYGDKDAFWSNCIQGSNWKHVPLIYTTPAGSVQAKASMSFNLFNQRQQADFASEQADRNNLYTMINSTIQGIGTGIQAGAGMMGMEASRVSGLGNPDPFSRTAQQFSAGASALSGIGGLMTGIAGNIAGTTQSIQNTDASALLTRQMYQSSARQELMNYAFSQSIVVPTISLPYNPEILRDLYSNGVFVFRYRPSDSDIQKQDKLLNMYGYRDTQPLDNAMFTSRTYFNYISARGVDIDNEVPHWLKDLIRDQINVGTRIWHVLPDKSHYLDNPVRIGA